MRRVWTTYGMLPLVLLIAASFLFIGRGAPQVDASAFAPALTAALSSSSAGATADINETASFGTAPTAGTRSFPSQSVYFTPASWNVPNCAGASLANPGACPYAFGEQTGTFATTTTFGLLNSQCAIAVPVSFPAGMRNASTDASDSITPGPAFSNLTADVNPADGVQDGSQHWNTLLGGLQGAGLLPAAAPRERQTLHANALGTEVWVDALTYDPGLLGGPATAPLGYATTFILQNANPLNPPAPSLITDTCGLFNGFSQFGLASGGATHRSNPGPGTNIFFFQATSQRDADQGVSAPAEPTTFALPGGLSGTGQFNAIDTCPFQPNVGSSLAPAGAPFNGDAGESPGDGIDAVCDPNPALFDGSDVDLDAYLNRGDNCPIVANGAGFGLGANNQQDLGEVLSGPAVDGGPSSDSIGDDCDINPTVRDGHFHTALNTAPVCVTGGPFADGDGDGWCDIEEVGIGGSTAGTPEALAVPGSCSDGADNDLDGNTDLNDTGCQLPSHDLSIKKLNGNLTVSCAGGTVGYNLLLDNSGAQDSAEISIYLDSQPSFVPPAGPSPSAGKSAGTVSGFVASFGGAVTGSGPINIDGDADVEWLTKAVVGVKHGGATTTVQFSANFPATACAAGDTNFVVTADVCHGNDVAPLGVGPLNGNCAGAAGSDGGQDRNSANDVITKNVDAQ